MKHHSYAEVWPLMDGEDFEKLKADIKANGQRLPVLVYQDQVLDGRNRERACEELEIETRYEIAKAKNDHEAMLLSISLNQHRRHLNKSQLAAIGAALMRLESGQRSSCSPGLQLKDSSAIAEKLGVHEVTVRTARRVMRESPVMFEMIREGALSTSAAAEALRVGVTDPTSPKEVIDLKRNARAERRQNSKAKPKTLSPVVHVSRPSHPKYLSQHEVDPEFTGTRVEFIDKYGHVQIHTAEQYATMRFSDWAGYMKSLARQAKGLPPLPERPVDHNWLRSPALSDIAKLTEALEYIRPIVAEAEALLATAVAAVKK